MESDEMSSDIAARGLQYTKEQWDEIMAQTEDYVRANPTKSLLYGVAAGFVLDRLPIFRILGGLFRLSHLRRDQALPPDQRGRSLGR